MLGASRESLASARDHLDAVAADAGGAALTVASEQLLSAARLLAGQPALRRSLSDQALPPQARLGLLEALLAGRLAPVALDAIRELVRSRWSAPRDLVDAVEALGVQAAFIVADADGALDEVEDELFRFGRIIDRAPELRAALTDPSHAGEGKRALVHDLLEGKVSPTTLRLVEHVVLAPRGRVVDRAIEGLAEEAAARRSRLIAVVRVAVPLTAAQHDRLAADLAEHFGHEVRCQIEIDPDIGGGVVVRVGDQLIDGSIVRRLAETRRRLAG